MASVVLWPAWSEAQEPERPPIKPPEVVQRTDAIYPPGALAERREGTAMLLVTIGVEGTVTTATVAESAGEDFDQAALAAVKQWRFLPARSGNEVIPSRIRIPFKFALPPVEAIAKPIPPPPVRTPTVAEEKPPARPSEAPIDVTVRGRARPPSRGTSDYQLEVGGLATVPRQNAAEMLKLAPGVLLTNEGGEGHAEQVFLRGFDAREGQDIEFSVDGVPINESGNLHGNGYSDTHFIIPELIDSLRVLEGPFDPRQGNYAVAGSAEYHLGLQQRGLLAKFSAGSFGSTRELLAYRPASGGSGTFFAAELYQTDGFGMNRDGRRGTVMAQYEGQAGASRYRIAADAYIASFHTAGVLRDDDYRAGRIHFFDTYDPLQGEDSARYSLAGELETKIGKITADNLVFAIIRPLRLRENFTGFRADTQGTIQHPHSQRGDLLDLHNSASTLGAKGSARLSESVFDQTQEIELGYYARGDLVSSMQQRIAAAGDPRPPYKTETNLDSILGDIGLYADANLRFLRWLSVRGGVRADLFNYDVNNNCAVHSIAHPSITNPPGDQSCLTQFGPRAEYRDPNQRVSTNGSAVLPRGSLILGPFWGISASASVGQGVRSIDPNYVSQDARTPFASIKAYEGGLSYQGRILEGFDVGARSALFDTKVDRDLIFSETSGRNELGNSTTRLGSASSIRMTGPFYDLAANFTYVKATFDDNGLLIPYVPDLVFRTDAALFTDVDWWQAELGDRPVHASIATGITYVGARPLPYGTRSDTIFTVDGNITVAWSLIEIGLSIQNLFDKQYRLGEYNYASDFHSQPFPGLVPVRHFTAGAPRTIFLNLTLSYGGEQ